MSIIDDYLALPFDMVNAIDKKIAHSFMVSNYRARFSYGFGLEQAICW